MGFLSWLKRQNFVLSFQKSSSRESVPEREVHKKKRSHHHQGASDSLVLDLFPRIEESLDFTSVVQAPSKAVLQKYLEKGEYPSFQSVAMFESSFVQVTRKGRHVFIHNSSNEAIIGIASTNSKLPLPNLLFIARPVAEQVSSPGSQTEELTLTRLLPLKFVRISIYNPKKQLIKIQLINGRCYYLQFQASTKEEEALFERWLSLVYLLHHPPPCYLTSQPTSCTVTDSLSIQIIPSEEEIEGLQKECQKGLQEGFPKRFEEGFPEGLQKGFPKRFEEGFPEGLQKGFSKRFEEGFPEGLQKGFPKGFEESFPEGLQKGFPKGFEESFPEGLQKEFPKVLQEEFPKTFQGGFQEGFQEEVSKVFQERFQEEFHNDSALSKVQEQKQKEPEQKSVVHLSGTTKMSHQSLVLPDEEYTKDERQRLEEKPKMTYIERKDFLKSESFEIYKAETPNPSRKFTTSSFVTDSFSTTSSSSSQPPLPRTFPVPKKEGSSSLNIVTLFSVVSKTIDGGKNPKNKN